MFEFECFALDGLRSVLETHLLSASNGRTHAFIRFVL